MKKHELLEQVYKSNLPSRAKQVMFYLINRANGEGICFPSIKTIANDCGVSERTVQRTIKVLLEEGYILKENRYRDNGGQSSNLYVLQMAPEKAVDKEEVFNNLDSEKAKQLIEKIVINDNNTTEKVEIVTFEDYKENKFISENLLLQYENQHKRNPLNLNIPKCHSSFVGHEQRISNILSALSNLKFQCHGGSDKLYPP